jgi:methionine-rich copper-binding protein CopC
MPPAADAQDARVQSAEIHGTLAPGAYTVAWSVVAGDGAESRGEVPFTIRPQ